MKRNPKMSRAAGVRIAVPALLSVILLCACAAAPAVPAPLPEKPPAAEIPAVSEEAPPLPEDVPFVPVEDVTPPVLEPIKPSEDPLPEEQPSPTPPEEQPSPAAPEPPPEEAPAVYEAETLPEDIESEYVFLMDVQTGMTVAARRADETIYPASMTKILTALLGCRQITDWDSTCVFRDELITELWKQDATTTGFYGGERVCMEDLIYGIILPSGADATAMLAETVSGSEEAFAELMNETLSELGCTQSHFCNASGLHDEDHYTTPRDLSRILLAAMDDERCRSVLSAPYYTSRATPQHPQGLALGNTFLQTVQQADCGGAWIEGAKTGFTTPAGYCCASFGVSPGGRTYVCITAKARSGPPAGDHIRLYRDHTADFEQWLSQNTAGS